MISKTRCPDCAEPAEVRWRAVLESTDGPIEHAKIFCTGGHWFLLPISMLDTCPHGTAAEPGFATSTSAVCPPAGRGPVPALLRH